MDKIGDRDRRNDQNDCDYDQKFDQGKAVPLYPPGALEFDVRLHRRPSIWIAAVRGEGRSIRPSSRESCLLQSVAGVGRRRTVERIANHARLVRVESALTG